MNSREIKINLEYENLNDIIKSATHCLNLFKVYNEANNLVDSIELDKALYFINSLGYLANDPTIDVTLDIEFNSWMLQNKDRILEHLSIDYSI
jgi:hypothetical protein